jgi:hypothetical protein
MLYAIPARLAMVRERPLAVLCLSRFLTENRIPLFLKAL